MQQKICTMTRRHELLQAVTLELDLSCGIKLCDAKCCLPAGYFHAPGALLSPLGRLVTQSSTPTADSQPLPPVSMLFCAIDGYELMQVSRLACAAYGHVRAADACTNTWTPCCVCAYAAVTISGVSGNKRTSKHARASAKWSGRSTRHKHGICRCHIYASSS